MGTMHAAAAIFLKELRTELRTRELLNTSFVFVLLVLALFSFSFDPTVEESRRFGPGLLWLAFLFAGSLMVNPSFAREHANDTLAALRLAPVDPFAILLGKLVANFVFLLLVEALLLPIFTVLYNVPILPVFAPLLLVLVLGTFGLSIVGTVFSALTAQARLRELLLPLLILPLLTPVLVAGVAATAALLTEPPELPSAPIKILVGFDIVFLVASYILFEYLLEE